jgi:hypothetical protein
MNNETIRVKVTETGQTLEVVVLSKRPEAIEVVIGSGVHSMKCELKPTRLRSAYAGSIKGRELIYERTPDEVKADIDRANPREYRR